MAVALAALTRQTIRIPIHTLSKGACSGVSLMVMEVEVVGVEVGVVRVEVDGIVSASVSVAVEVASGSARVGEDTSAG